MRLLTLLLTLVTLAQQAARAQGTFNASNNYTVPGATQKAFIWDYHTDSPLSKAVGRVQIINAADGSTLSPGGDAGVALALDGLFFVNGLSVPGTVTGGTANIIVRAWDSSTGPTWSSALVRSDFSGGRVTVAGLGGGTTPAATFAQHSNFSGLIVGFPVPEPTTLALATLGITGLFAVACRRKLF